jgi:hypothetical protein
MWCLLREDKLCDGPNICPDAVDDDNCEACPLAHFRVSMQGWRGALLRQALELDFFLQMPGASVRLEEIPAMQFSALKIIHQERDRFNETKNSSG